jgi:hypothetical protein
LLKGAAEEVPYAFGEDSSFELVKRAMGWTIWLQRLGQLVRLRDLLGQLFIVYICPTLGEDGVLPGLRLITLVGSSLSQA